ncbi:MAG: dephospho-CoA kinase, partial [Bacteroidota bacterium]
VSTSRELQLEIIELIGKEAFKIDGTYNTEYVSNIVFKNPMKLEALNQLIHPRVRESFSFFINQSNSLIVFGEAAILYETGAYKNYDEVILVTAPLEIRIERCIQRDNLSRAQIQAKINRQWTDEEKIKFNPIVLKNDGETPLLSQIEQIIQVLSISKKELESRADISFLVQTFYMRVLNDEMLSPFFKKLDFDRHLPKMIDFWCFVLLGESGYSTNVIEKHLHMPLKEEHFEQWLNLFHQTLNQYFEGENVETAKQRAFTIAWTTKSKMNII